MLGSDKGQGEVSEGKQTHAEPDSKELAMQYNH